MYSSRPRRQGDIRQQSGNRDLDSRLHQLERLVGSIAAQRSDHDANASVATKFNQNASSAGSHSSTNSFAVGTEEPEVMPGRMMANENQTVYVSAIHWAATCDEVYLSPKVS